MDLIELYQEIIAGSAKAADVFFRSESILKLCRYWNGYIFNGRAENDEILNSIYLHLMENECHRLKQVSNPDALLGWINRTAVRYLIRHKGDFIADYKVDSSGKDDDDDEAMTEYQINKNKPAEGEGASEAQSDVERLLNGMHNTRYVLVIRELCLAEREPTEVASEMGVTVANLYNIKKRALEALTKVALKDIKHYANK